MATEIRKIIVRKGTAAELQNLQNTAGGLDEGEFGWTTDVGNKKLYIGVGGTQHTEVLTESHAVRTDNPHQVTLEQVGGEPAFEKNGAFNKEFGTTEGTVSEGNHTHAFSEITTKPDTLGGYGITDADTSSQVTTKITNAIADLVNLAAVDLDTLGEIAPRLVTAEGDIDALQADVIVNADDIANLELGAASLGQTVNNNIADIATNASDITDLQNDKQDNLVKYNNYKTVNGVDLFDMAYNNTGGDAYLSRTPVRTFIGSASTDDLREINEFLIGNSYGSINGNPYTNFITNASGPNILESVILYQQGAPNNNTAGQIGYFLWDIVSGKLYRCTTAAPSSQFYQWEYLEDIVAYSSFNIGNALNESTIYRFKGAGVTTEWEMNLAGGLNTYTQGTLQLVQSTNDIVIFNSGLTTYNQLYIKYIYQDSVTNNKYTQAQTIYPLDILDTIVTDEFGDTLEENVLLFKTPEGNNTTLRQSGFSESALKINFGTNALTEDFQEIFIYRLN
jgi:hypothetical protein